MGVISHFQFTTHLHYFTHEGDFFADFAWINNLKLAAGYAQNMS